MECTSLLLLALQVFPTVENVKNSLEGYKGKALGHRNVVCIMCDLIAGGSIPYSTQNAHKQAYLTNYMW